MVIPHQKYSQFFWVPIIASIDLIYQGLIHAHAHVHTHMHMHGYGHTHSMSNLPPLVIICTCIWTHTHTLTVRPTLPRLGIQLINNSPRVQESTVEVDFILTRPASKVTCQLGRRQQQDCKFNIHASVL